MVALFRHGVRAPLAHFDDTSANKHSTEKWPGLADWQVMDANSTQGWGNLTIRGQKAAQLLGGYYAKYYTDKIGSNDFKVYVWADSEDQRTRETAKALAQGIKDGGVPERDVTVASLPDGQVDLLFHPFKRGCGRPNLDDLERIANYINSNWSLWRQRYDVSFKQLYGVLGCGTDTGCRFTTPDKATPWTGGERNYLLKWGDGAKGEGRFSYASSATETFLLEYGNNMTFAWNKADTTALHTMPFLHEFFFGQTERRWYLAKVEGSNLIKEIYNVINRKAGDKSFGCPHATPENQFIGLVGHDTNLARVCALLGLRWVFDDPRLPDDTRGLPDNDALPAGALVFELRLRSGKWWVRVEYVTQSLSQMRNGSRDDAFRLKVLSPDCLPPQTFCEMPLETFNRRVNRNIGTAFLSRCEDGRQACGLRRSKVK